MYLASITMCLNVIPKEAKVKKIVQIKPCVWGYKYGGKK